MTSSIKNIAFKMLSPKWVLCVVVLMNCNQLVVLIRQFWLPVERPTVNFARSTNSQVTDTNNKMMRNYQYNLFGTELSPSSNVKDAPESSLRDAPLSTLKINVTGIVASSSTEKSIAIIEQGGKQFSFGIGDKIPEY
ncbi:MAG: type II secretion system protein N, partial [Acinetobacter sp.]